MKTFQSLHPYDQSVIAEYPVMDAQTLEQRLECASRAFGHWRTRSIEERSDLLKRVAAVLRANSEECARIITLEMGKILSESRAEVEKCAMCCDFYAKNAAKYINEEILTDNKPVDLQRGVVVFEPLGVIFAIMPWNFPF